MIAPIPVIVAAAAAARRRTDGTTDASWPAIPGPRRRRPEDAADAIRAMEAEERAERAVWRWTLAMLATGVIAAAIMLWAWLRDTGRI